MKRSQVARMPPTPALYLHICTLGSWVHAAYYVTPVELAADLPNSSANWPGGTWRTGSCAFSQTCLGSPSGHRIRQDSHLLFPLNACGCPSNHPQHPRILVVNFLLIIIRIWVSSYAIIIMITFVDLKCFTHVQAMRWSSDRVHLKAWQRGFTGYPLVDAAMRQLWQTGWMNNYMRHVVASFLIAYLHIPWQEGYRWFQVTHAEDTRFILIIPLI